MCGFHKSPYTLHLNRRLLIRAPFRSVRERIMYSVCRAAWRLASRPFERDSAQRHTQCSRRHIRAPAAPESGDGGFEATFTNAKPGHSDSMVRLEAWADATGVLRPDAPDAERKAAQWAGIVSGSESATSADVPSEFLRAAGRLSEAEALEIMAVRSHGAVNSTDLSPTVATMVAWSSVIEVCVLSQ